MNRKLAMGCVAALATLSLAASGSTYAALSDVQNISGNSAGATFLKLDLGKDGTGVAAFTYSAMRPGASSTKTIWLANHGTESPAANLSMSFAQLSDTAAPCNTALTKALAEAASHIGGCTISTTGATGTPAQGNLSRVLTFEADYFPTITTAGACAQAQSPATSPVVRTVILPGTRGNLAAATGTPYPVIAPDATDLVLQPGHGGCIGLTARWQPSPAQSGTPAAPVDAAAQGDSLSFDIRFDLTQV